MAFYYPLVLLGRAIVDYDAFVYFEPQRAYLGDMLRQGRIPLWNPYLFMGAPFLANPQTAVLYPPSWLFALLPVDAGYTAQLVLHGFLAAWLTYLLARRAFGVAPLAAAVGGLSYAFGGFAVGQVGHLNQLSAAAWLPGILLAYDRAVAGRSPRWVALGALALAMQVLAGHPQETYMTGIVLGLFGLVRAPWTRPGLLLWAGIAGVLLGGLGILAAAAQLLPTLELTPLSIRGGGVEWKDAVASSLPPWLVPRALFPPFWLKVASTEYLGYTGMVPLAAGLLGVAAARSRFVVFGLLLCCIGLFLALGENNPWYATLFETVPGLDTFRVPSRWLLLWQVGVALLATLGTDWLVRGARIPWRSPGFWLRVLFVLGVIVEAYLWQRSDGEPIGQRRTPAVWAALALVPLLGVALSRLRQPSLATALVVLVTAGELFAASNESPARQAPPGVAFGREPTSIAWIRQNVADPTARTLSVAQADYIPADETQLRRTFEGLPKDVLEAGIVATKWRETQTPNVPLQYGVRSADGYDGGVLPLQRFVALSTLAILPEEARPDGVVQSRLDGPPDPRVLDVYGVRYVLENRVDPPLADADASDVGSLRILARRSAAPLTQVVFGVSVARNDEEALARMRSASFDSQREVVLSPSPDVSQRAADRAPIDVTPTVAETDRWQARVSLPAAGYLLQREAWYPGWRARVDGTQVEVLRADVLFRAVPLPPGEHTVEVYFESPTFNRGLMLSAVALAAIFALLAWSFVHGRVPIIGRRAA